jgi:hypothetical protein
MNRQARTQSTIQRLFFLFFRLPIEIWADPWHVVKHIGQAQTFRRLADGHEFFG